MLDDIGSELDKVIDSAGETTEGQASGDWSAADILTGAGVPGAGDLETPGSLQDILDQSSQGSGMPTAQDMEASNASNAAAREAAIKGGLDPQTAQIMYPDFDTPEDMLRIN